jgi:Gelsolin repeat
VPDVPAQHAPRLFALSDAVTGGAGVAAEEVPNFAQSDLLSEDVFLLDAGGTVYLWLGSACSENEKREAPKVAEQFLEARGASGSALAIVRPCCNLVKGMHGNPSNNLVCSRWHTARLWPIDGHLK